MKSIDKILFSFFLLAVISCSRSVRRSDITADELLNEIKYLSSDSLKGRMTGSPGDSLAAEYIKSELSAYGLIPLTGDGLQRFKYTEKVVAGKDNSFSLNGTSYSLGKDFTPMSFSENGLVESEVVFAGYGFNINNDSVKWDDYNGLNVKGKWVMLLRADPEPDNSESRYITFSNDRDKALLAKDMGAAGVILVSGQAFDKEDSYEPPVKGEFSVGIPVIRIKRTVADQILAKAKTNITSLENKLNMASKPASFSTGVEVNCRSEVVQYKVNTRNVVILAWGVRVQEAEFPIQ
jgi:aminopeptidase YwaD